MLKKHEQTNPCKCITTQYAWQVKVLCWDPPNLKIEKRPTEILQLDSTEVFLTRSTCSSTWRLPFGQIVYPGRNTRNACSLVRYLGQVAFACAEGNEVESKMGFNKCVQITHIKAWRSNKCNYQGLKVWLSWFSKWFQLKETTSWHSLN